MSWLNEIRNFLEDYSGVYPENSNIDIWKDMGVVGDDFHEMISNYAQEYNIDMSNYLWYFHADEEGNSIGSKLYKPTYKRVERIPVTPQMLANFIKTKKWEIEYPEHSQPKIRIDLLINLLLILIFVAGLIIWWIK